MAYILTIFFIPFSAKVAENSEEEGKRKDKAIKIIGKRADFEFLLKRGLICFSKDCILELPSNNVSESCLSEYFS